MATNDFSPVKQETFASWKQRLGGVFHLFVSKSGERTYIARRDTPNISLLSVSSKIQRPSDIKEGAMVSTIIGADGVEITVLHNKGGKESMGEV